jgi:hypothetical protein
MSIVFMRAALLAGLFLGGASALASAATSATPAPTATATPKPRWAYRGKVRAYDFTRQNASASKQDAADTEVNQASFNLGIAPHVEYNATQNWTLGATYQYANPYTGCSDPTQHATAPCRVEVPKGTLPTGSELNYDDTLPGYQLNSLYEAYLQYQNNDLYFRGGNQVLNTPWALASDTRIMPTSYQAADLIYKLNNNWQIEAVDSWRFLPRTESDFSQTTLLTRVPPVSSEGFGGLAGNIFNPSLSNITTPGFAYARAGYTASNFTANFHYYDVYDITTIGWLDAKYTAKHLPFQPYVSIQGGFENNTGRSVVGQIDSNLYGIEGGLNLTKNLVFQAAYDNVPTKSTSLVLPTGFSCSATSHTISSPKNNTGNLPYFLPSGGTPDCNTVNGVTKLTYGGWASPFTDGYGTDVIYTTSLTQGMTDRRSPGQSYKLFLIATSSDKRLVSYVTEAGYDYGQPFLAAPTYEWDFDALYYFNKPAAAGQLYKGFTFRYRYGERDQASTSAAALPLFKYNRFQAEYDF